MMRKDHVAKVKAGRSSIPYVDVLIPEDPLFRILAERLADGYLALLTRGSEGQRPSQESQLAEIQKQSLERQEYRTYRDTDRLSIRITERGLEGIRDSRVGHVRQMADQLPQGFCARPLREALRDAKNIVTPDRPQELQSAGVFMRFERSGFSENGRFRLKMYDMRQNQMAELELTEQELDRFVGEGRAKGVVQTWQEIKPLSLEDWRDNVDHDVFELSTDAAQAPGGIDLNPVDQTLSVSAGEAAPAMQFNIDPSMFQQYRAASGFTPVILNVQPMDDLPAFLGVREKKPAASAA
jgi:hypothetical protein